MDKLSELMVNHPPHYMGATGVECIEAIEAQLTIEEYRGFLKGNIAKYVWRERHKGKDSLKKAAWYLDRLNKLDAALAVADEIIDESARFDRFPKASYDD